MAASARGSLRDVCMMAKARKRPGDRCTAPLIHGRHVAQSPVAKPAPWAKSQTRMEDWKKAYHRTPLLRGLKSSSASVEKKVTPRAKKASPAASASFIRR
jgi:hypothetical protein